MNGRCMRMSGVRDQALSNPQIAVAREKLGAQPFGMVREMLAHQRGDEEIAVVVALVTAQRQGLAGGLAHLLEALRP
jgi:hypothetical protein